MRVSETIRIYLFVIISTFVATFVLTSVYMDYSVSLKSCMKTHSLEVCQHELSR